MDYSNIPVLNNIHTVGQIPLANVAYTAGKRCTAAVFEFAYAFYLRIDTGLFFLQL